VTLFLIALYTVLGIFFTLKVPEGKGADGRYLSCAFPEIFSKLNYPLDFGQK